MTGTHGGFAVVRGRQVWRQTFSDEEWTILSLLLGLSITLISAADDVIPEAEEDFLRGLWTGERAGHLLGAEVHARLGSRSDLAREVVESWTDGVVSAT